MSFARPPRKHFLRLQGLGVRDLVIHGRHLYILAGPTMDLDGPVFVYEWRDALDTAEEAILPGEKLRTVLEIPFATGSDHAEGMSLVESLDGSKTIIVCYDTPNRLRIVDDAGVRADVFQLR